MHKKLNLNNHAVFTDNKKAKKDFIYFIHC